MAATAAVAMLSVAGCKSTGRRAAPGVPRTTTSLASPDSTDSVGSVGSTVPPGPDGAAATRSVVARAKVDRVAVFADRRDRAPLLTLSSPNEDGAPLVLLVSSRKDDWLDVVLPLLPAPRRGWIRVSDVELTEHDYRIRIDLSKHRITVVKGGETVFEGPVGVAVANAPPGGEYYTTELLQPPKPDGPYGRYLYGISGYPDLVKTIREGKPVVALHGTNDEKGLGKDVAGGSIRMGNDGIAKLAGLLPLGTPLSIVP